ncbi:MAG: tRNA (N6-isopentenyl adenosine(37)-C2)-methylthiotransferase MiaB [Clostridia bacterium]|nr:tRNA (N6-isopentenyl adenosine(37)-C2)-methylthiotransferase MiaB [Clostridia bacterium]
MDQRDKNTKNVLSECGKTERAEYIRRVCDWNDDFAEQNGRRRRAYVLTFGCQQNEADGEKMAGMARAMGYEIISAPDTADLIMVNTCAIREHAEKKALSVIGQFKHIREQNPELIIGVCGCMVTQEHRCEQIKASYPYVSFVLGTSSIHRMPQMLWNYIQKHKRLFHPGDAPTVEEGMPVHRTSSYRAWVSIMYGCNNFCSYCIVPYVRGRERSRHPDDIVREVRELVAAGYKDITLLGQNVNSYGKGAEWQCDFADLIARLDGIEGDFWLRFMTSHPKDASRKLIDVMAVSRHVARHFHLPLQSGSDKVLSDMNRRYDTAKYLDTVAYMREKIPDIAITSDIIVGFPTEDESDFEGTLSILDTVKFDMLYSFIYSPRKGTPAAEMPQLDDEVKGERFNRLLTMQNPIAENINLDSVGKTLKVLCDGESKSNSALLSGRDEKNKIVFFPPVEGTASAEYAGRFVNVKISLAEAFALYGEIV